MKGASSKEKFKNKVFEVSYNYVNLCGGNQTEALRKYYNDHNEPIPYEISNQAYRFFKNPQVIEMVARLRKENYEEMKELRANNIAVLRAIATSLDNKNSDKIAAIKELNLMCGYNHQNINVEGSTNILIELTDSSSKEETKEENEGENEGSEKGSEK